VKEINKFFYSVWNNYCWGDRLRLRWPTFSSTWKHWRPKLRHLTPSGS